MRTPARLTLVLAGALLSSMFMAASGHAAESGPKWAISAVSMPTDLPPNDTSGESHYQLIFVNTGDAPTTGSITITDVLPPGLTIAAAGASGFEQISGDPVTCTGLQCTYSESLPPGDSLKLTIPVDTGPEASSSNLVTISGGGASEASRTTPTSISSTPAAFGIAPGSPSTTLSIDQAGAHANLTTMLAFNTINSEGALAGDPRDTIDDLPAGFAGDLTNTPTCPVGYFSTEGKCPLDTQVGSTTLYLDTGPGTKLEVIAPVYNLAPSPGSVAKLAFNAAIFNVQGEVSLRPGDDGIETTFHNITETTAELDSVLLSIWGVPADSSHDAMRGLECTGAGNCLQPGGAPGGTPAPFLTNPTRCSGQPLEAELQADSWQQPGSDVSTETSFGPLTGCEHLTINPSMTVEPTTTAAYSASGLNVEVGVPQTYEDPYGLATSHLKETIVTLPEGTLLNPSTANGLGYCTPAQLASETATSLQGEGCPSDSKIGTVRAKSPVISEEATGAIYVAQPYENPFDSLFAVYVVAKIPDRGVIVRTAGEIQPNPLTGQLTTIFPESPQLPFSNLTLSFRQGTAAPLITPPSCGAYTTTGQLAPWSSPSSLSFASSSFQIDQGIGGAACPSSGIAPFAPQVAAGTLQNGAGTYSPLDINVTRNDGEQEITGLALELPPGLSANLTGIPFCSEADIALARTRTGLQEETEPSCPASSQIGHTLTGAGVGQLLIYTPGSIYLAGPYEGAPFSIVSITSAKAGPFDLGTVVLHLPLQINPETAAASIPAGPADQIPHIIKGVAIHVRDIRVYIDRPAFALNPTSCARMSLGATVIGSGASFTTSADDVPVAVSDPFQASDCASLAFKPTFSASTPAKTSKSKGVGLTVKLTYPRAPQGSEANLRYVKVDLPIQMPSRQSTLNKACIDTVFDVNPAACPAGSIVGHAVATTPILPVALVGPAYFVSHGGAKFPELVTVLQGYGVTIELHGETFISKAGITSSTFHTIPDQPVSSFELTLPQGKGSALAANLPARAKGNLCNQHLTMPTALIAQNGAEIHQTTAISVTGCPKAKRMRRAQKLAAALKTCRKKATGKRAACKEEARKQFGRPKRK